MNIHLPIPALSPYIKNYRIVESETGQVNRVVPDTSLVMAFRFRGEVSYVHGVEKRDLPVLTVSGLRKSGRLIHYSAHAGNVLVTFKEGGAHAFLKEPLHELFDESVALAALAGYRDLGDIEDRLAGARSHQDLLVQVERFLLSKLCRYKPDLLIAAALEHIHRTKGMLRVKELANTLCISQDAFEKRFRRVVGVSPKTFSSIVRMKSILSNGLQKQALAEAAFNAGYFDQPHFNKDFKLFTGQTPTEFLKSPVFW